MVQAIKENPQLGHHHPQRSQLAGWGPGPLQPMASPQHRPLHVSPPLQSICSEGYCCAMRDSQTRPSIEHLSSLVKKLMLASMGTV